MSDLISRSGAIDAVADRANFPAKKKRDGAYKEGLYAATAILDALPSAERNCFTCGMENGVMVFDPEDVPNKAFEATEKIVALSDVCKWIKANFQLNPRQWVELAALPSAEAVQGEWKPFDLTWGRNVYFCTACKESTEVPTVNGQPSYNFCPNCGARMLREDGE